MARKRTSDQQFPGAVRVHQALLKRIQDGEYVQGMWLPTESTLSSEFDVDRSAVRSALSRLADAGLIVREHGRRPVVGAARPSQAGRPAPSPAVSAKTIAAIVFQVDAFSGIQPLMRGIQQGLRELNGQYRLLMFDTQADTFEEQCHLEMQALEALEPEGISGAVIWQACGDRTTPYAKGLIERGTPLVFVDRYPPGVPCDYVGIDDRASAKAAVAHLIGLGHRRIGYATHEDMVLPVVERMRGYHEALIEAGIEVDPALVLKGSDLGHMGATFMNMPDPPTAIFAVNDLIAYYLIEAMDSQGIRVPQDVSVMGFDDLEHYMPGTRSLTSVHIPFQRIGRRAVELLLRRLDAPDPMRFPYQHILLPTTVVQRSSTPVYFRDSTLNGAANVL